MSPHSRVLLFCVALLAAPFLWSLGERLGGEAGGWLLAGLAIAAAALYAEVGRRKPPTGTKPV